MSMFEKYGAFNQYLGENISFAKVFFEFPSYKDIVLSYCKISSKQIELSWMCTVYIKQGKEETYVYCKCTDTYKSMKYDKP